MFIFIQIRSKHLKTIDLIDQSCSTCKNRGVLKIHFYQNYTWLFGPIAPVGKHATIECGVCKTTIPNKKWTKEFDAIFRKEKKLLKTPLRLWRGSIILLLLIITPFVLWQSRIANPLNFKRVNGNLEINKTNIKNCKEGDVLFATISKLSDDKRSFVNVEGESLVKVVKIEGDKTILKIHTDKFKFEDQFDLELSDLDDTKFVEIMEIKTDPLRKLGNLVLYTAPSKEVEFHAIGRASAVIQQ